METKISAKGPRRRRSEDAIPAISATIVRLRLETGLTQQKLAEKAGLSVPTISRIEKGDLRISARNLELLLNFFGMTLVSTDLDGSGARPEAREKKDTYAKW